ncbi:MAG: hypothetical protein ACI9MR_004373 [Myxococcota bacterium]|jgi:uncharacterized protein
MLRLVGAVLLLLPFGCASAGCASGGSTAVTVAERRVDVDFLWYRDGNDGPEGGTSKAQVRLQQNPEDRVRIGIFEGGSLQTGAMWRASVWLATFQAAMEVNQDPARWVIAVETPSQNRIDGPSAGGLLTTALMAAMTDAPARPDFTMTGTINPDGTIGPVGGVPLKMAAALAQGKRIIGFPMGQREAQDPDTKVTVDLIETFSDDDVTLVEITDVRQAYELMTGRKLELPLPASVTEMALSAEIKTKLVEQARTWLAETARLGGAIRASDPQSPIAKAWGKIDRTQREIEVLLDDELAAAGYWRAATLYVDGSSLSLLAELSSRVVKADYEGAMNFAKSRFEQLDARLKVTVKMFHEAAARSPGDLMTLIDGMEALGSAMQNLFDAGQKLKQSQTKLVYLAAGLDTGAVKRTPENQKQLVDMIYSFVAPVLVAEVNTIITAQHLTLRPPRDGDMDVDQALIERLVTLLTLAARANIEYFDSTFVASAADHLGISLTRARNAFKDPSYQHVRKDPEFLSGIFESRFGKDTPALAMMNLSTAFGIYIGAASLIAKYYSVGFNLDDNGGIVGVRRPGALRKMLELAELKAREHAALAQRAIGEIPTASRIAYAIARSYAKSDRLADKAQALEQYWRASMLSKLVVMLRPHASTPRPSRRP